MNAPLITQPPYSQESEEAVLGSLLINPDGLRDAREFITPTDFFILRHQWIYEAMIAAADRGDIGDYVVIVEELRTRGKLSDIGGMGALLSLANKAPSSANLRTYAGLVARIATRRQLLKAADEIRALALNEELSIEAVQVKASAVLDRTKDTQASFEPISMKEAVDEFFAETEATHGLKNNATGLETGLVEWDEILDGFQLGSLNMIGARPAMGKSALLVNIAYNVASKGGTVYFWTGEMPVPQLQKRFMSLASSIQSNKLRKQFRPGGMNQDDWSKFVNAVPKLSQLPIFFDDTPGITPAKLRARASRLARRQHGLALVIVDYIGLMQAGFAKDSREQEISYISRQLKELAMEVAPVACAVQLNRAVENRADKRPVLADMRDSGAQEQDADTVTFIYRDAVYNKPTPFNEHLCELNVAKNRHGEVNTAKVYVDLSRSQFGNLQHLPKDVAV